MQGRSRLLLFSALFGACAAPPKPQTASPKASAPAAPTAEVAAEGPPEAAPDPFQRFQTALKAAEAAVVHRVTLAYNDFEADNSQSFGIDGTLSIRLAVDDYTVEAQSGRSEYVFRSDVFECAHTREGAHQEAFEAVYCADTGGSVVLEHGDEREPPRAPTNKELESLLNNARRVLGQLPDVELDPSGSCSSSQSYPPLDLGSTSYTPTSHVNVSPALCPEWERLREKAAEVRFPGDSLR
jgi:hypothetical protein